MMRFHLFSPDPTGAMRHAVRPRRIDSPIVWLDRARGDVDNPMADPTVLIMQDFFEQHPANEMPDIMDGDTPNKTAANHWKTFIQQSVVRYCAEFWPRLIVIDDPGNKGSHPRDIRSPGRANRDGLIARIMYAAFAEVSDDRARPAVVTGFGIYHGRGSFMAPGPVLYGTIEQSVDRLGYAVEQYGGAGVPWLPFVGWSRPQIGSVSQAELAAHIETARQFGATTAAVWFPRDLPTNLWALTAEVLQEFSTEKPEAA